MAFNDFDKLASTAFDSIKNTLGVNAEYKPRSGGVFSIRGVFDNRGQEVDPDTEVVISSNVISFGVKLSDLPGKPIKGDVVTVSQKNYRVVDVQDDGIEGVSAVLILHKASE